MVETIGKPGMCIHSIDREEILIALDNLLDMRKRNFERTKNDFIKEDIITSKDIYKNPTIIVLEDLVERAQNVKNRVINTPEC